VLGQELRKAREAAGLTQEEVATRAKITREYVSHLEREEYTPTVDVLLRVCAAMGIAAWRVIREIEEGKSVRPK
jgi:transcriptional regulator with XRE-family HTH domain